jgi:hypothetical protein
MHSESDLVVWAAWSHSETCYDKKEYLENVLIEYDICSQGVMPPPT